MSRLFFHTFTYPTSHAWMAAFEEAETCFGCDTGPVVAARTLDALKAIRCTRRSTFAFSAPHCPGCRAIATAEEQRLMTSLVALRNNKNWRARVELCALCENSAIDGVVREMDALSSVISSTDGRPFRAAALH